MVLRLQVLVLKPVLITIFQTFSKAIFCTVVHQLTQFQLIEASGDPSTTDNHLGSEVIVQTPDLLLTKKYFSQSVRFTFT